MTISKTNHAFQKQQNRGISDMMIQAAISFGDRIYAQNSLYYFLGKRAVKRLQKLFIPNNPEKWEGLVLVCDPKTEALLTVFKNKNWLKKIRYN